MAASEEKTISELISKSLSCSTIHEINSNSYTSPAYMDSLNRLLTIDDVPMSSCDYINERPVSIQQETVPWDESAKNFVFDLMSVDKVLKVDTIVLLYEFGYKLPNTTAEWVARKHSKYTTVVVDVIPTDQDYASFTVTVRHASTIISIREVDDSLLVSALVDWYRPHSTLVFCHDSFIREYRQTVSMMSESTWSIQCNTSDFVTVRDAPIDCKYYLSVYSYPRSKETRAVGKGEAVFTNDTLATKKDYSSKLNYYSKCIRGSRHNSGRCYDCNVLYGVISGMDSTHRTTASIADSVSFAPEFIASMIETVENY